MNNTITEETRRPLLRGQKNAQVSYESFDAYVIFPNQRINMLKKCFPW